MNDLICYGTGSPLIWNHYLRLIQKKKKLISYDFRCKEKGWRGFNIKAVFENGRSRINTYKLKIYSALYSSRYIMRPSCYSCRYADIYRPSDITIGDFWGVERVLPELDDDKGVSLVLVNSEKGEKLFDEIKNETEYIKINIEDCLQPNLQRPTRMPENRALFWESYKEKGLVHSFKILRRIKR